MKIPYLIPIPENPASTRKLGTTPAGTALFLQMSGQSPIGTYRLYIEANFNGYQGRGLHLRGLQGKRAGAGGTRTGS